MAKKNEILKKLLSVLVPLLVPTIQGCATTFTGSPKISRVECEQKCTEWGMVLSSMVQMGQYSNGCVCKNKSDKTAQLDGDSASSVLAGVSGVETQRQRMDIQHQHYHHH